MAFYRTFLQDELGRRQARNARFSLRAFARVLGTDPGTVSRILTGKSGMNDVTALRICERLKLDDGMRTLFLRSARLDDAHLEPGRPNEIPLNQFAEIATLLHLAIMELTYIAPFGPADLAGVARRLRAGKAKVAAAVATLVELGLMRLDGGVYAKAAGNTTTADKAQTTEALRAHQIEVLTAASRSVTVDPLDRRCTVSMTLAINPDRLPLARRLIHEFLETLGDVLESGERREVYQFGASLFPLQEPAPPADAPSP